MVPSSWGHSRGWLGLHGLLIGALQGPFLEGLLFGWLGISGEV
jgi:hypothetical protein